ncbi:hypothetical protein ATKI12_8951 [Kitasatospora sp. Ki12]
MVTMSGAPWSVALDYSHDVAFALAVRDALGITDPQGLPALDPPQALAVDSAVLADGGSEELWQRWWSRALDATRREEAGAPALPEGLLGRVVEENFAALHHWSGARKREVARVTRPTHAVPRLRDALREHERASGVRMGGFRLRVTALPVAGPVFLPLDEERILVSITVLSDRADYLARLLAHVGRTSD